MLLGNTNKEFARYHNKLVGNSPELCRGLDSHGFKDLDDSMRYHNILTASYFHNEDVNVRNKGFYMGTMPQVWSTMTRCWSVAPTSDRIIEDVSKFRVVLEKIIEAKGCIVSDENFRSGKRYLKVNSEEECKVKPCKKQRKDSYSERSIHPDAELGKQLLHSSN